MRNRLAKRILIATLFMATAASTLACGNYDDMDIEDDEDDDRDVDRDGESELINLIKSKIAGEVAVEAAPEADVEAVPATEAVDEADDSDFTVEAVTEVAVEAATEVAQTAETTTEASEEADDGENYPTILRHYLYDSDYETSSYVLDGVGDAIEYTGDRTWYFALRDLDRNGQDELLIAPYLDDKGHCESIFIYTIANRKLAYLGGPFCFYDEQSMELDMIYSINGSEDIVDTFVKIDGDHTNTVMRLDEYFEGNTDSNRIGVFSDDSQLTPDMVISRTEALAERPPYLEANWLEMKENNIYTALENRVVQIEVSTTDGGANLRKGPGTEYEKVFSMVADGTVFDVIGTRKSTTGKDWAFVNYQGQYCWVALSQTKDI